MNTLSQAQPAPQTREEIIQHGRRRRADEAVSIVLEIQAAFTRQKRICSDQDIIAAATVYAGMLAGDA
jgi:hypothetical protein